MNQRKQEKPVIVHCRVGSSENGRLKIPGTNVVHCRVGSSEIVGKTHGTQNIVHCRVGSSEISQSSKPS